MARDPSAEDAPELQSLLDALDDSDCQAIIKHLEEPMTAQELSEASEIPLSTTYRKLGLLTDASLVTERTDLMVTGDDTRRYELAFEAIGIVLTDERELEAGIARKPQAVDERLATLWSEVRKEP
jgi:DNA-binding transcriptional ArsR family regulator